MAEFEALATASRAENERVSAEEMDERREQSMAYEYLCRLEEAKKWIELCLREELPATTELEESLRNGVFLAKLANFFSPKLRTSNVRKPKKIYDDSQARYQARGLHFRHTDNINYWISAMQDIGLPADILPETMDVYDKKNMPRVVYCVHALSVFLHRQGLAPKMHDLYGKVNFTEEEISAMRKELLKYGMDMPAFGTIGGILAAEIPIDEAALHAAIIVINETIDKDTPEELLACLNNPGASLMDVDSDAINEYCKRLKSAKQSKSKECQTIANLPDVVHDAYDELLTRKEIQDCLHDSNSNVALEVVLAALDAKDSPMLIKALRSPYLSLENIDVEQAQFYMVELEKVRLVKQNNIPGESGLSVDDIQSQVDHSNRDATIRAKKKVAINNINEMLQISDAGVTLAALQNPDACLPPVHEYAAELYQEEFTSIRNENQADLSYEELNGGIIVLSVVANINLCVESGNSETTYAALCEEHGHIFGVSSDWKQRYQSALFEAQKQKTGPCLLLTHAEIQQCVDSVNALVEEENERIIAIQTINEALQSDDRNLTIASLVRSSTGVLNVEPALVDLYHHLLRKEKSKKASAWREDLQEDADLWIDEIQQIVDDANSLHSTAYQNCAAIAIINVALDKGDVNTLELAIQNPEAQLLHVSPVCLPTYSERLLRLKRGKSTTSENPKDHLVEFQTRDGISLFLDAKTMKSTWKRKEQQTSNSSCLSRDEIQNVLTSVTSDHDYQLLCKGLEPQIVQLQAYLRMYLERSRFLERLSFLRSQTDEVIKIQACWRGYRQRHKYHSRIAYLKSSSTAIVKVQSVVRMHLVQKKYLERLKFFQNQALAVIKIQNFWRGNKARKEFQELTTATIPSFAIVRKFVHLLNLNNSDFSEELELHHLRGEVVQSIRHNQQLEKDLATMDIKIGLLVKNRITLQDVVAHGTKMNSKTKARLEPSKDTLGGGGEVHQPGLKSLSKESRLKIDAYQHLFYALQTQARYLSRLIFLQLPGRVNKFMESFILTLFNYASNQREEYLLLKLFKNALEDEIRSKVDQPQDIIVGNPTIIKMVVGFNRSRTGQGSLREILGSLVKHVLNNKDLHINTNPVDVYKSYVNQLETDSGNTSELPYNVTQNEALQHKEVRNQIEVSVANLKEHTLLFFDAILGSIDKIPYGIMYMAKVMKSCLENKFPQVPEKEVLKVIGNLLYYRYINSAIVAPDAFDIVDIGANESLTSVQRTNLGSIAKILQFSTSKTGFDDESPHLVSLNPFIMECHEKFKKFFLDACNVPDLEEQFKVDEYTEATMVAKPVIFISLQDICEIHSLLLEHQNVVAPDADDPLHELLEDLGSKPSVEALVGENPENLTALQMAKIEVCLSLSSKFELAANSKDATNRLFVRTKQMIVDIMHCVEANNITDMIKLKPKESQKTSYFSIVAERNLHASKQGGDNDDDDKETISYRTFSDSDSETLNDAIDKTMHNLNMLELAGYVSSKTNYEEIVKAIALEIRNRRRYRIRRRQDLVQLRTTLANLQKKTAFHEDQVDYYNQYLKQCLNNMIPGSKKVRRGGDKAEKKVKSMSSKKYTASKLYEKGVIVGMEGLAQNQFKNVLFEITPTDVAGVFVIKVKYMGTNLSMVELDIQDLLELQFEGISVTKLFDRAEVNVNLLLFLLNSEFYGKSR